MSMNAIYDVAPQAGTNRIMLVMMPGAQGRPQELVEHGFVRALRERRPPVDVAAVATHMDYYLERSLSSHLAHDIIAPARAGNYRRIWLMGISLGGMGALIYAHEHPAEIEGVILLAPFLGVRGTIAEVVRAGGLARWQPGAIHADDDERRLLAWIKAYESAAPGAPKIYLGYGTEDRFAAASRLLAERLPATQVVTMAGDHDWTTWSRLWERLLEQDLFGLDQAAARKRAMPPKKSAPIAPPQT
jgi:pimeloyl-ACP methyl ester carboxylesterase